MSVGGVSRSAQVHHQLHRERYDYEKIQGQQTELKGHNSIQESMLEEVNSSAALSEKRIIKAIEHANESFRIVNTRFEFSIHEATKEIMVKVIDEETGEVIREIPPEKILDLIAKLWELAGILVDEKA